MRGLAFTFSRTNRIKLLKLIYVSLHNVMLYYAAQSNEYLCKTGFLVPDIEVVKTCFKLPGQRLLRFSLTPHNYSLEIKAMSLEKLQFVLPVTFAVGPEDSPQALQAYCRFLGNEAIRDPEKIRSLIEAIIKGEVRIIAAGMKIEEMFSNRKLFKTLVMEYIEQDLKNFGLRIYNTNIKELADAPGSGIRII